MSPNWTRDDGTSDYDPGPEADEKPARRSTRADATWNAAIEAAAKVAEDFNTGSTSTSLGIAAAIRALRRGKP